MRRANRCTRYPSKDDILKIFVKCGGSSLTEVSPPAPRPVDCKAYQLLPFSSADSLVIIGDISAFCTPWLIPLCPHPPLSNHLRGSSTFSQMKEERSSREGENKGKLCQRPSVQGECTPSRKVRGPSWDRTPPQLFVE